MAFAPGREALPYGAALGADFSHDWVFEYADSSPEPLIQVVAASVVLTREGSPAIRHAFGLGAGLTFLPPNVIRMDVDKIPAGAWPAGMYRGGLMLSWADGIDEAVLEFAVKVDVLGSVFTGLITSPVTKIQRQLNTTRIIRTAGGSLSSIVPQIRLTPATFAEDAAIGSTVALVTLDPPGADVTFTLIDDGEGLLELVDGYALRLTRLANAAAQPIVALRIEGAVEGGDTRLRADLTLTVTAVAIDGQLDFSDPGNPFLVVI